jgi:dihydroorotase
MAITSDVSAHHVHFSDRDIGYFDSNCNLIPPLRDIRDRDALRMGLIDGTIDAICSDHTPVDDDAKQLPFAEAEPGATGLELLLPLTLKWGREVGVSLAAALSRVTTHPLRVLGLPVPSIAPGEIADLCVFDPEAWWRIEAAALHSQGKNTPMLGMELQGRVRYTLVGGSIVFDTPS